MNTNTYQAQQSFTIKQTDISPVIYVLTSAFWYPAENRHQIETSIIYQGGDDEIKVLQKNIHGSSFDEDGFYPVSDFAKMFHKRLSDKLIKKMTTGLRQYQQY